MSLRKKIGKKIEQQMLKNLKKELYKIIQPQIKENTKILDLGCEKNGSINYNLINQPITITGYDTNKEDIELFKKNYSKHKPTTKTIDIQTLNKLDETYDIIILAGVIQYLTKTEQTLSLIHEALKPNGIFIITTLNQDNWLRRLGIINKRVKTEKGEQHIYTNNEMKEIITKNNFKIITYKTVDIIPLPKEWKTNLIYVCTKK